MFLICANNKSFSVQPVTVEGLNVGIYFLQISSGKNIDASRI